VTSLYTWYRSLADQFVPERRPIRSSRSYDRWVRGSTQSVAPSAATVVGWSAATDVRVQQQTDKRWRPLNATGRRSSEWGRVRTTLSAMLWLIDGLRLHCTFVASTVAPLRLSWTQAADDWQLQHEQTSPSRLVEIPKECVCVVRSRSHVISCTLVTLQNSVHSVPQFYWRASLVSDAVRPVSISLVFKDVHICDQPTR